MPPDNYLNTHRLRYDNMRVINGIESSGRQDKLDSIQILKQKDWHQKPELGTTKIKLTEHGGVILVPKGLVQC